MVVTTDYVCDAHVRVVDNHRKVVGRRAVRARNDEIVELGVGNTDEPPHRVIDDDLALERVAEPNHGVDAVARRGTVTPATGVAGLEARGALRLA